MLFRSTANPNLLLNHPENKKVIKYKSTYNSEVEVQHEISSIKELKEKIQNLIDKMGDVIEGKLLPIKFTLDDPSGNSFIENPYAPQTDPYIKVSYY